jgi:soluble lytic murein transglycosylase-like protein
MAVIAQESQGDPKIVSEDGGVGLMQIVPRPWLGTAEDLKNWDFNLNVGMSILSETLRENGGDVLLALALYNCSEAEVARSNKGKLSSCGRFGGYRYARRVLEYWCPAFATGPDDCSAQIDFPVRGVLSRPAPRACPIIPSRCPE